MKITRSLVAAIALLGIAPATAQAAAPKLLVVVSVDQFSADLFAEYRGHFTGGFARLLGGAVFPSGYQSHAATETCPGHSTILTGARPARTGIVANNWIDFTAARGATPDFDVYCAEDERIPGSTSRDYTVSDWHLKVPTLGEWMKLADPASRVVSVAGKDRAAVMMGGHKVDELWWFWDKTKSFQSYAGRTEPARVTQVNAAITARLAEEQPAMDVPAFCQSRDRAYQAGNVTVGTGRFERPAGSLRQFKASPEFDEAIMALAAGLALDMKLGQGAHNDLLIVGASATDYVGHGYGPGGLEMCIQMMALDQALGRLFAILDTTGVDYAIALTADHGGLDIPERAHDRGAADAERAATQVGANGPEARLTAEHIGAKVATQLGITGPVLWGGSFGDVYIDPKWTGAIRDKVRAAAIVLYRADPQVFQVYTRQQIAALPSPHGPPESWSMEQRARAAYDPARSGDLIVALRPRVTPIAIPRPGGTATHGSFWDYDRRVPILFWQKGMSGFEHSLSIETVDIAPTLAGLIGVRVPVEIDGRCLDLDPGPGSTCAH